MLPYLTSYNKSQTKSSRLDYLPTISSCCRITTLWLSIVDTCSSISKTSALPDWKIVWIHTSFTTSYLKDHWMVYILYTNVYNIYKYFCHWIRCYLWFIKPSMFSIHLNNWLCWWEKMRERAVNKSWSWWKRKCE
jgi:hypothetical protein